MSKLIVPKEYYLNVMAGPVRTWKLHNDPGHEWIFNRNLVTK